MRTTVTLDDTLYHKALEYHPSSSLKELLDNALKSYIHQEASRALALMGASDENAPEAPPRRRL